MVLRWLIDYCYHVSLICSVIRICKNLEGEFWGLVGEACIAPGLYPSFESLGTCSFLRKAHGC